LLVLAIVLLSNNSFAQPPGNGWGNPIFADEFNGNSVNTSIWRVRNEASSEYFADMVSVSGGKLIIKNNLTTSNVAQGKRGGWIDSKQFFGNGAAFPKYGYFEARIRINRQGINFNWPGGKIWPTWWLWGGNYRNGGPAPSATEIDVMEYSRWTNFKADNNATSSHHYFNQQLINGNRKFAITDKNSPRDEFNWHRWGVLWTPTQITFYYDGVPFGSSDQPGNAANDVVPTKLIFSSSPHVQTHPDLTAAGAPRVSDILPAFEVDWVRVWQGGNVSGGNTGGANIPIGQTISFRKKGGDGQYVTTDLNQSKNLIARGGTNAPTQAWQTWERFVVQNHPSGGVALKALASNQYVRVNGTQLNTPVRGDGGLGSFSNFNWAKGSGNNEFALQSVLTGKWVQAAWNQNNAVLYPRGNAFSTWETFVYVTNPSNKMSNEDGSTKIEVYPNPVNSNDYININIKVSNKTASLEIYSMLGQIVYENSSNQLVDGPTTLRVPADFDSGIYLVKVNTGGKISTTKIIVK